MSVREVIFGLVAIAAIGAGSWAATGRLGAAAGIVGAGLGLVILISIWRSARSHDSLEKSISRITAAMPDLPDAPASKVKAVVDRLDRLEADASLREQILSSMSEGVILMDPSGLPVYFNPAAEAMLGPQPALPDGVFDREVTEFAVRHPRTRHLRATTSALEDARWLVVIQDVTDARRTDMMRRDFVANVSHELKTPVAGILASAETLEWSVKEDPDSTARFVDSLLTEARRLSKLVDDLLDLARLEQEEPRVEPVDLSDIVNSEIKRARPFAEGKALSLHSEVADNIVVTGDGEDLGLAVRNLLTNAIRYTDSGRVKVSLGSNGRSAEFKVEDTGVGIPQNELPRIFERFYRVDKARSRQTGGTGLGLSIVRHVAESHGGDVRAESQLGQGSQFILTLPVRATEDPSG